MPFEVFGLVRFFFGQASVVFGLGDFFFGWLDLVNSGLQWHSGSSITAPAPMGLDQSTVGGFHLYGGPGCDGVLWACHLGGIQVYAYEISLGSLVGFGGLCRCMPAGRAWSSLGRMRWTWGEG
jgi:hypothetical protein